MALQTTHTRATKEGGGRRETEPAGDEDDAPIVFIAIAVWHGTTSTHHDLDSPLHHHPSFTTTTVSPTISPLFAIVVTPWPPPRSSHLGEPKAEPLVVILHRAHTHTHGPRTYLAKPLVLGNVGVFAAHPHERHARTSPWRSAVPAALRRLRYPRPRHDL